MPKNYLLTRPEHDDTTHYLSNWIKETISIAENNGIKVSDLHRHKAKRSEVESRIRRFSPELVVFNGHGDENTVTGHGNEPIIKAGVNENLLSSRVIYALSCKSAKNLGPRSIDAGAISFSGYNDDFVFFYEPMKISRPTKDETAEIFLKPSVIFVESLLKGSTINEARNKAIRMIKGRITRLLSDERNATLVRYLWWNLKHFVTHGNLDAMV